MSLRLDPTLQPEHPADAAPITLLEAMASARKVVADLAGHPVDAVSMAERAGTGWRLVVDVVEASARMGDNDLLAAYEVTLAADGGLEGFRRLRRYHREDAEP